MNPVTSFARKELKYLLTPAQARGLPARLSGHIVPDAYPEGMNLSIYYDTPSFLLARRSLEKPAYKEKLRLRVYGDSPAPDTPAFAEIKKKCAGTVYKRRLCTTLAGGEALFAGEAPPGVGEMSGPAAEQIGKELARAVAFYPGLAPALYVGYHRLSFRDAEGTGLRLTFDDDIRWRETDLSLLAGHRGEALLPPGQVLLEIKILGAMPLWLARALGEEGIYPASFSKYSRAYGAAMARCGKERVRCA